MPEPSDRVSSSPALPPVFEPDLDAYFERIGDVGPRDATLFHEVLLDGAWEQVADFALRQYPR